MEKRKNLYQLAGPIFIEILLFMLLGVADIFMLSQFDDRAAGAVGASNQIIGNLNIIFAIISAGTAVLVAQNVGARQKEEVEKVSAVSLVVNLLLGIVISIAMVAFGDVILIKMGVTADLIKYASEYMKIVGGALFFQAILNTLTAILRSHGYTTECMMITVVMNILNIFGDAVFIFGLFGLPVLGVKGVAIATTFSRICATIAAFTLLLKKVLSIKMFTHLNEKPVKVLKRLVKVGFPAAMENMSYSLSQTVLMRIILVNLGEVAYITRTYVWTIVSFAMLFSLAIGQANQIMIGQLVGANKIEEAYHTGFKNFRIAMIFSVIGGIILFFFGKSFMSFYTDNPEIIMLGATTLMVDAFLEPGRNFNIVLINGLRGAGDVIFPVVMAIISMWIVAVGGGYFFGVVLGYGLPGMWATFMLDEWIRGVCMLFRWNSRKWAEKSLVG
ncbi:putative MATE family efflux protein [Orenia metallireducens]|uniref:Putative efflux protein, MATE family n=1 Tax=Orenia metallireducens TaxID=1413210 RepID=A0A285I9N3_9FIRM|nr:MATE family efflux transporter [Orenia metallireducens]PRX20669.1 putative MATE family efflux protein [Orenia metallireducens]SNY44694.1 putative efflux protein, MATE family [Orenia metallireducens]